MKFFTDNFQVPIVQTSSPQKLIELANSLDTKNSALTSLLDKLNINHDKNYRLIDEIIKNIEENKFENINLIEWVYCLSTKSDWDQLNLDKSKLTSEKIWQFAQEYKPLRKRLFWHLVSYYFDQDEMTLAPSLAQTFSSFEPQNKEDYITLKIIDLLTSENYIELASLCVNECLQPNELLYRNSLPYEIAIENNITLVEKIQSHFPLALNKISNPQAHQINFIIDTLEKLSPENQLIAVENLLHHILPQVASNYPKLVNWVRNNYILTINKSSENQLSPDSQILFKKWIGAVNYKDFSQLIDLIIDRISIDSLEDNQLMKKKIFWYNYSDRFTRIRILLPFSTIQAFGTDFDLDDITQLINDGSQSTEVCIVDLDDFFMVEFFRGKGCEIRIFPKTNEIENELFKSSDIFLKRLRYLTIEREDIIDNCDH